MAENYYTQDTLAGIITVDTSAIQAGVEAEIKAIFGNDIDLTPETPQGRLVEVLTAERAGVVGFNAANASQLNLTYATGLFLDAVGSYFGVTRVGQSQSRVFASVTGVAGTVIPAGSVVKSDAGDEFYAENAITLPIIGAYFLSVEYGSIPCEIGTLTTIVSSVLGWETVNNAAEPAPLGADAESDASYRIRIKNSRYSGTGFVADISSKINSVDNVLSSFVYDNGTASPVTYDTVVIDAHSLVAVVDGGTDADIANAIYTTKSAGCGYTKINGAGNVTISSGNPSPTAPNNTVTVGGQVYKFVSSLTTSPATIPNEVKIAATLTDTAKNLTLAINGGAGAGTNYSTGTVANLTVTATDGSAGVVNLAGGVYGVVLCSNTATNTVSTVTAIPQWVSSNVQDGQNNVTYPVIFNRPEEVEIDIKITVKAGDVSGAELEASIKDAISAWAAGEVESVDGLKIGQDVSPFEVASAVTIIVPAPYVQKVEICVHGGSLGYTEVPITSKQVARVTQDNITVVIV